MSPGESGNWMTRETLMIHVSCTSHSSSNALAVELIACWVDFRHSTCPSVATSGRKQALQDRLVRRLLGRLYHHFPRRPTGLRNRLVLGGARLHCKQRRHQGTRQGMRQALAPHASFGLVSEKHACIYVECHPDQPYALCQPGDCPDAAGEGRRCQCTG